MTEYLPEEREVLRISRSFQDLVGTEGWREYERVIQAQIADRERITTTPLSERVEAFEGLDFMTRAARLETIKGAIIGLRLALSIPTATISHAKDIRAENSPEVDEDG